MELLLLCGTVTCLKSFQLCESYRKFYFKGLLKNKKGQTGNNDNIKDFNVGKCYISMNNRLPMNYHKMCNLSELFSKGKKPPKTNEQVG